MSRLDVVMPDETTIRTMSTLQLRALAVDAEVPDTDLTQLQLTEMMLTVRALFDGRQYNIPRLELVDLHTQLFGPTDLSNTETEMIALACADYFWTP